MPRPHFTLPHLTAFVVALAAFLVGGLAQPVQGQMVQLATPRVGVGHSFQENIGVNFGFNIPGARPGPNGQLPNSGIVGLTPQGNITPNGALQFRQGLPAGMPAGQAGTGFGILGGGGGGAFFGITGGQSSNSSITSSTPSVTVMNGGFGTFQDVRQQPFVTGLTPVVGDWVGGPVSYHSTLADRVERLYAEGGPADSATRAYREPDPEPADRMAQAMAGESTAAQGDLSVAEIRRQQESADASLAAEVEAFIAEGRQAEAEGKLGVAVIYYRRAARQATGEARQELLERIQQLNTSRDR